MERTSNLVRNAGGQGPSARRALAALVVSLIPGLGIVGCGDIESTAELEPTADVETTADENVASAQQALVSVQPVQVPVPIADWGYSDRRWMVDVNGDRKADYCRAVGANWGNGSYLGCSYALTSTAALETWAPVADWGYSDRRWFADVNGDGKADFCRGVGANWGSGSYLGCSLSAAASGAIDTYAQVLDWGYADRRWFADVNGDGKADFCRAVGNGSGSGSYLACSYSLTTSGEPTTYAQVLDWGYADRRWIVDVNGDGKADYCRAVGASNGNGSYMGCSYSLATSGEPSAYTPIADWGHADRRWFVDVNGDGAADYCRATGASSGAGSYLSCSFGGPAGLSSQIDWQMAVSDWRDLRWMADVTGDRKAELLTGSGGTLVSYVVPSPDLCARNAQMGNPGSCVAPGSMVDGYWQSSGGPVAGSAQNTTILADVATTGSVTFELNAPTANGLLILLDANGNEIARDDSGDFGGTDRITAWLGAGTYKLVAATRVAGKTSSFTMMSNSAKLRYPQRLDVVAVQSFQWIYDDVGAGHQIFGQTYSGCSHHVNVWRPVTSQYPGYYSLGDVAMPSQDGKPASTIVVKGEGDLLARPVDYNWVWDDTSTGGSHDAAVWAPVAPPGYTCLGNVFSQGYGKPSTDLIRCIKSGYVLPARPDWVWDDIGCGADDDLTLFVARATDDRSFDASTCAGQGWYGGAGVATWALNKSAVAKVDPNLGQVDAAKAARYAPRVWLAAGERFLPSSVEHFLPNVHKETGDGVVRYSTNEPLGCESCSDPAFLYGQSPAQTSVPVYAQIVNRTNNGQPSNVTDVMYWMFYPYNDGKDVCIGWWFGSSIGCGGGYESFGNHVGDWEHMMIRFVDGNPTQVFLSAHDGGVPYNYGDPALPLLDGHPVVYAALGSHGLYPDARRHTYATLPNGFTLDDDTSPGIAWDTWNNVVTFGVRSVGSYTGSLAWLNFIGDWGNAKGGCGIYERVGGFCIREGGPSALMPRSLANASVWAME